MAEIVDFGLQQHKIKMDSRYFENVLSVVAGDTGRRVEVQLLDTNGMVQDTTGLNLRLNAVIAGKATFTDATSIDASTGKYQLDLSNGMFLAPGNWQFQWQITDSAGIKLHSFAFAGKVGKNISEGGSQATNFYLNLEDLKAMQEDFINGAFDSAALETNIAGKLTTLETEYAPRLTEVTAQLEQTVKKYDTGVLDLDVFDEPTRNVLQGQEPGTINAVLGTGNVKPENIADDAVTLEKLNFVDVKRVNLANPEHFVAQSYVIETTGVSAYHATDVLTGYIPVEKGKQYTATSDRNKAFYDHNKIFVSGIGGGLGNTFVSPIDGYVRLSFTGSDNLKMVVEGAIVPVSKHEFSDYEVIVTDEKLLSEINSYTSENIDLKDNSIPMNKLTPFTTKKINLANPDNFVQQSYVISATGIVEYHATDVLTGYIPVEKGKQYTATSDRNKAFYDHNKIFVSGIGGGLGKTFTSPVDGYVRLSFTSADTLKMVVEGTVVPSEHIPYGYQTLGFTDENWKQSLKNALEIPVSPLSGLKWNALGDSITAGAGTTKTYLSYIAEATGIIPHNYGVSGTQISSLENVNGIGMSVRYADMDNDADIITVFGGTNDWGHGQVEIGSWNDGTSTTMYGGTQTLIEGLINKYPTKKIGFILPLPRHKINGDNTLGDYVAVIKEVCDRYSIPTLDLYHESGIMPGLAAHKTALIPDGTHPNAEGHRIIATKIQRFLESL